ncbi:MAG: hypothetical protein AB1469_07855 [Pseudomonadota bacterium]
MKKCATWLALCILCMVFSVQAKPRGEEDHKERGHAARGERSLDETVSRVRRETRGRVLSADTEQRDGESVHRIKVLTPDGRVRVLTVDEDE